MISFTDKISILQQLGKMLSTPDEISPNGHNVESFGEVSQRAYQKNNWFTKENTLSELSTSIIWKLYGYGPVPETSLAVNAIALRERQKNRINVNPIVFFSFFITKISRVFGIGYCAQDRGAQSF